MQAVLDKLGNFVFEYGKHRVYCMDWDTIKPLVKKWSCNRDPDMKRVFEIRNHLERGGHVPFLLHLAELKDEGLICYDGNHRREAFNMISRPLYVMIDVMFDASKKDVYEDFTMLNKSVQVPSLYLGEDANHDLTRRVREDISALVRKYETQWRSFCSSSARCHAPNFNRDVLMENIFEIWREFDGMVSVDEIEALLHKLNDEYKSGRICKPHSSYKPQVISKCASDGLWLFLDKRIPIDHVKEVYNPFC